MNDEPVNDERTSSSATPTGRRWSGRRTVLLSLAVAVAVVLAAGRFLAVNTDGGNGSRAGAPSVDPVTGTVWVANEEGGSLSVIDVATNRVVTTVEGIEGPHNVQVSPDGRSVWAVSGHDSVAVMLDAATLGRHGVVPTGGAPAHVVVSPDGRTTYTTNGAEGTVTVIDAAQMKPVATIAVGAGPHGLRPSPDGRWVYVANLEGSTVSVLDTAANQKVADIEVGNAPAQVAFSPDGQFVYASLSGEDSVAKIDVASRRLVAKLNVGSGPIQTYVSPDNRVLLVANQGTQDRPSTTVSVIDPTTFTVAATIQTGRGAHGVVIEPSSRLAYITNIYGNDVAVVDLQDLRVAARVPVGDKPNGVSFSPVLVKEQPPVKLEMTTDQGAPEDAHTGPGH